MIKILLKVVLHLGVITALALSILVNFKIFQRVDKIQPTYRNMHDKLASHAVYSQIPTEQQIEMEILDDSILMLHDVSGRSSSIFGIILGICILLIFTNLILEIINGLNKTRLKTE